MSSELRQDRHPDKESLQEKAIHLKDEAIDIASKGLEKAKEGLSNVATFIKEKADEIVEANQKKGKGGLLDKAANVVSKGIDKLNQAAGEFMNKQQSQRQQNQPFYVYRLKKSHSLENQQPGRLPRTNYPQWKFGKKKSKSKENNLPPEHKDFHGAVNDKEFIPERISNTNKILVVENKDFSGAVDDKEFVPGKMNRKNTAPLPENKDFSGAVEDPEFVPSRRYQKFDLKQWAPNQEIIKSEEYISPQKPKKVKKNKNKKRKVRKSKTSKEDELHDALGLNNRTLKGDKDDLIKPTTFFQETFKAPLPKRTPEPREKILERRHSAIVESETMANLAADVVKTQTMPKTSKSRAEQIREQAAMIEAARGLTRVSKGKGVDHEIHQHGRADIDYIKKLQQLDEEKPKEDIKETAFEDNHLQTGDQLRGDKRHQSLPAKPQQSKRQKHFLGGQKSNLTRKQRQKLSALAREASQKFQKSDLSKPFDQKDDETFPKGRQFNQGQFHKRRSFEGRRNFRGRRHSARIPRNEVHIEYVRKGTQGLGLQYPEESYPHEHDLMFTDAMMEQALLGFEALKERVEIATDWVKDKLAPLQEKAKDSIDSLKESFQETKDTLDKSKLNTSLEGDKKSILLQLAKEAEAHVALHNPSKSFDSGLDESYPRSTFTGIKDAAMKGFETLKEKASEATKWIEGKIAPLEESASDPLFEPPTSEERASDLEYKKKILHQLAKEAEDYVKHHDISRVYPSIWDESFPAEEYVIKDRVTEGIEVVKEMASEAVDWLKEKVHLKEPETTEAKPAESLPKVEEKTEAKPSFFDMLKEKVKEGYTAAIEKAQDAADWMKEGKTEDKIEDDKPLEYMPHPITTGHLPHPIPKTQMPSAGKGLADSHAKHYEQVSPFQKRLEETKETDVSLFQKEHLSH